MKELPKNWLLQIKPKVLKKWRQGLLLCLFIFVEGISAQNLVPNGSFETYTNCPMGNGGEIYLAPPWVGVNNNSVDYYNACGTGFNNAPYYGGTTGPLSYFYLNAKEGSAYAGLFSFQLSYREYLQVKLTNTLQSNSCYYVEFYAANYQTSKYRTNNIAAAFSPTPYPTNGSGSLINIPSAITNYNNPLLADTVKWQKISGMYQANGMESYILLGNFWDDSNTDTVNIYPPNTYPYGLSPHSYIFIDAVSVYSINPTGILPWNYNDTIVNLGDSVFIGNNMGGIFNASWYNMNGSLITNAPGIYVKPVITNSYVVQYTICGTIRSDTVKVTVNAGVGINELKNKKSELIISPNSASGYFELSIDDTELRRSLTVLYIYNSLGQKVREEKIIFNNNTARINTFDFGNGIYFVTVKNAKNESVTKKLVITN